MITTPEWDVSLQILVTTPQGASQLQTCEEQNSFLPLASLALCPCACPGISHNGGGGMSSYYCKDGIR